MSSIKVEILLPLKDKNKKNIDVEKYDITQEELENRFNGYTMDPSPLLGSWRVKKDKTTYETHDDENIGCWVKCNNTKINEDFFSKYKKKLKKRFEQQDIMIYYFHIYEL